jgi:hypothetical protein
MSKKKGHQLTATPRVKKVKYYHPDVLGIDSTEGMCYDIRISKNMPMRYLATSLRELADMIDGTTEG